jgi:hypothetical protein
MRPEPERKILQLARGVEMSFRRIVPAGPFRMGRRGFHAPEERIHLVQIAESFWMAKTPGDARADFDGRPDHPAESTSLRDLRCSTLSSRLPYRSSSSHLDFSP